MQPSAQESSAGIDGITSIQKTQSVRLPSARLVSLDVFRGLVILAMLVVNNLGDFSTTGYFWKHADFIPATEGYRSVQFGAFASWWGQVRQADSPISAALTQLPLWKHCTLADFVMPMFMLIIGLSTPFSAASARARGVGPVVVWLRVVKRSFLLVLLGWILCYFRDQFAPWVRGEREFRIVLGMDVLQLLGWGYLLSRILYELPIKWRIASAALLLLWHGVFLSIALGGEPLTAESNPLRRVYAMPWPIWSGFEPVGWLSIHFRGMLSVPPAAGMMLIGSLMGDWLRRREVGAERRTIALAQWGLILAIAGFLWGFLLPFNKPCWTPSYLLWCAGAGAALLSVIHAVVDGHGVRGWTSPFIALGSNAIAAYFITILAKVLLLNTPRIDGANAVALSLVRYATASAVTLVWTAVIHQLIRASFRSVGWASWGIAALALPLLAVLWYSTISKTTEPTAGLINLAEAVLRSLKQSLGAWEGGWVFTLTFVLFWWQILAAAHRRGWHWKL